MPDARIEDILRRDSIRSMRIQPVETTPVTARLHDVIARMQTRRVAAVMVSDGQRVVGIFTERDLLNRIVGLALNDQLTIGDVMTPSPLTLSPDDRIADAVRLMTQRGYRHVPLVDASGRGVGMISARDIVDFVARHFPQEILNLPPDPNQFLSRPEGG